MDDLGLTEPKISSLEQASPPYWNRSLYCFKLPFEYDEKEITHILEDALRATILELPVLKGQLVPVDDKDQPGKHDLVSGGIEKLFVKDYRSTTLDFDQLSASNFPLATFEDDTFWALPKVPSPGDKVPVFALQVNFIRGGMLLGVAFWHIVMDGLALATALRVLSQNCRRIQDHGSQGEHGNSLQNDIFDKSRMYESPPQYASSISDHPEYIILPEVPTGLPSFMTMPLKVDVFHISPASVKALKVAVTPIIKTSADTKEPMWVSTNDAITALIWRSLIVATYSGTDYNDEPMSCCQVAVNARPKMSPPLPANHFGCALTFGTSDLPISSILTAESLPVMALMVRQSIMKVNSTYIESLIAMMRRTPDYRRLLFRSGGELLGRDTVMTSWAAFPLYEYDWGPVLGGKCERVRAPKLGMFNGLQTILPALPERLGGGYEVMIGLEAHVMEKLKKDEMWSQYCSPIKR